MKGILLLLSILCSSLMINAQQTYFVKGSVDNIQKIAASEDKPYFIKFGTSWCLPCKQMDREVFSDLKVSNYINKNFIAHKVNAERAPNDILAMTMDVKSYPTIIFFDAGGNEQGRMTGYVSKTQFLTQIKKYGPKVANQLYSEFR